MEDYTDKAMETSHANILKAMREKENETFKFIIALISGALLPWVSYFINEHDNSFNHFYFVILSIVSIFIFWWGAYFVLTLSYQYRNLQRGLSEIQKKLKLFEHNNKSSILPKDWYIYKKNGKSRLKEVLTEFYKPHFYAFLVGEVILFTVTLIILLLNSFNEVCFISNAFKQCFIFFIIMFILILLFVSFIHVLTKKCYYDKKIMSWKMNSAKNQKEENESDVNLK